MNTTELEELITDCPTLYHMAERGSWQSIYEQGLLSTTALLDLYRIAEPLRHQIEKERRNQSFELELSGLPKIVVRDQFPMTNSGLLRCLPKHITPRDWCQLLNGRVFFWLSKHRLMRLLNAGTYRSQSHDVLEVCTRRLVEDYFNKIWLCPINSGCTRPMPHPRDERTFRKIEDYPYSYWRTRRRRGERVVEFSVEYSVPNIREYVTRVVEMKGTGEIRIIRP